MNISIVIFLVSAVSIIVPTLYLKYRDYKDGKGLVVHSFQAPKDLSVLEVGYFYDNKIMLKDVLAWIVELVLKGNLDLVNDKKGNLWVNVKKKRKDFTSIENKVWKNFFASEDRVSMDLIVSTYLKRLLSLVLRFRENLADKGYLKDKRKGGWIWALFAGLFIYVLTNSQFPGLSEMSWLIKAIFLFGFPFFGTWIIITTPRRTEKGKELFKKLTGFKRYLRTAEKDREKFRQELKTRASSKGQKLEFSNLIPYMIVLNVDKKWYETLAPVMQDLVDSEDFLGVISSY